MLARNEAFRSETALQAYEQYAAAAGRANFWAYRQLMNPRMKRGWFQKRLCQELQRFYCDMVAGKKPVIVLQTPPQHGKSLTVIDFIAWVMGKNPNLRTIFASFSDRLGIRANLRLQRSMDSENYQRIFPDARLSAPSQPGAYQRNHTLLEMVDHEGSFRNTTCLGAITGESLDLGVIDDPIKGRAEANSLVVREKTWSWLTDDFMTRFDENAGLLLIMTRWHLDDPAGRLVEHYGADHVRVLRFPALAERDERHRSQGDPLFPELKSTDFLSKRRKVMTLASWEAVYQQNPIVVGGNVFPIDKLRVIPVFERSKIAASVRAWDKAGTEGGVGAYTAGLLMHKMQDGTFVIEHVTRGHWGALEREQVILNTARNDSDVLRNYCWDYKVAVEQEPGSGGKESAEATVRNLAGYTVVADKVTGSKEVRAEPFAAQVQGGNVWLVAGEWVQNFLDECEFWPNGKYKDQVDAGSMAFTHLTAGALYDHSYSGFQ